MTIFDVPSKNARNNVMKHRSHYLLRFYVIASFCYNVVMCYGWLLNTSHSLRLLSKCPCLWTVAFVQAEAKKLLNKNPIIAKGLNVLCSVADYHMCLYGATSPTQHSGSFFLLSTLSVVASFRHTLSNKRIDQYRQLCYIYKCYMISSDTVNLRYLQW